MLAQANSCFRMLMLAPLAAIVACGASLPEDVEGYEARCIRMNKDRIEPYEGDPHKGWKNVYVCNLSTEEVRRPRPFPDGTLIVKDSRREGEDFTWLVATARKANGQWSWDEYTRNFSNEDHRRLAVPESKCSDCHKKAESSDFIFTRYQLP